MTEQNSSASAAADQAAVLTYVRNHTGVIELNRPRALNSLDSQMLTIIDDALRAWRDDAAVEQVLVVSSSPKAFCSGGDVRSVRSAVLEGRGEDADDFFALEYRVDGDIAEYPKPYICVIDGIAMGGGLGISAHGAYRVVTDKAFASMPEMNIGYVTDVGLAYRAQRMVGTRGVASPQLAKFWGITGYRMYAADMLWSGLATHYVAEAESFVRDTIELGIDAALDKHAAPAPDPAPLAEHIEAIEETFAASEWGQIRAALAAHPELAELVDKHTAQACPTSIVAALELCDAEEKAPDLRAALEIEYSLGTYMCHRADFAEGVRAVLVDKDQDPIFDPADLGGVDVEAIRSAIAS